MITFQHNLKDLIGRLEQWQTGLNDIGQHLSSSRRWSQMLQTSAKNTLWVLSVHDRELGPLIPAILETFTTQDLSHASVFMLAVLGPPAASKGDIWQAMEDAQQGGLLGWENLREVQKGILEWVELEKIHTAQDAGLTDQEIAKRLEWIMGLHGNTQTAMPEGEGLSMKEAGDSLGVRIEKFMQAEHSRVDRPATAATPPDRARLWLQAVAAAWLLEIKTQLPLAIAAEMAALRERLKLT